MFIICMIVRLSLLTGLNVLSIKMCDCDLSGPCGSIKTLGQPKVIAFVGKETESSEIVHPGIVVV